MAIRLSKGTKMIIAGILIFIFLGGVIGGATGTLGGIFGAIMDWFDNLLSGYF